MKRSSKAKFFPGGWVFPGGAVDAQDQPSAWSSLLASKPQLSWRQFDDAHFRVAAVRELFEETNIPILDSDSLEPTDAAPSHDNQDWFLQFCQKHAAVPKIDSLIPWSRWVTPIQEKKRFDTMFYVAMCDNHKLTSRARYDEREAEGLEWFSPSQVLEEFNAERVSLPPPTYVTLIELSKHPSYASLVKGAAGRDLGPNQPHIESINGKLVVAFKGDTIHPETVTKGQRCRLTVESPHEYKLENYPPNEVKSKL